MKQVRIDTERDVDELTEAVTLQALKYVSRRHHDTIAWLQALASVLPRDVLEERCHHAAEGAADFSREERREVDVIESDNGWFALSWLCWSNDHSYASLKCTPFQI